MAETFGDEESKLLVSIDRMFSILLLECEKRLSKTKYGNDEVEILKKLQNCDKIIHLVEDFHENYQTILITEYLTGKMDNISITRKPFT